MPAIAASIVLAPFENLSGDPTQDVLAGGFMEDGAAAPSSDDKERSIQTR